MAWTEITDTIDVAAQALTCWACAHGCGVQESSRIDKGEHVVLRRGTPPGDGQPGTRGTFHVACALVDNPQLPGPTLPGHAPADEAPHDTALPGEPAAADAAPPETASPADSLPAPADDEAAKRLRRLAAVERLNDRIAAKEDEHDTAKARAKKLKEDVKELHRALHRLIRWGEDPQTEMFDDADADEEGAAPEAEWRSRPLSVLAISESLVELLAEGGIDSLGKLKDLWDAGKTLDKAVKGIGAAKALTVSDAFADYGAAHPEVYGDQPPAPAAATPDDDPFAGDEPAARPTCADEPDDDPFDGDVDDEDADDAGAGDDACMDDDEISGLEDPDDEASEEE